MIDEQNGPTKNCIFQLDCRLNVFCIEINLNRIFQQFSTCNGSFPNNISSHFWPGDLMMLVFSDGSEFIKV